MLNNAALIEDYQTMTMTQIADKYGVSVSTIFRHLKNLGVATVKSSIKSIQFTHTHQEVITGSLLGDGSLSFPKNSRSAGFRIEHSIKQADYLHYKYELLKELCNLGPRLPKYRKSIVITTAYHPALIPIYEKWYPNGKKVIPFDQIEEYLTPLALAIWYMDDGTIRSKGVAGSISTASFTFDEVNQLIDFLLRKYDIRSSVSADKGYPRLYIPGRGHYIPGRGWKNIESEFAKFVALIRPYVPVCMSYKLGKA